MAAVTSRPSHPMAPIYSTMERYPSGPLPEFPPPAPAIHNHRSLRSRRGVTMQVQIPRITLPSPVASHPSPWSAKGHIQPHRNHLPRRRNPRRVVQFDNILPDEPRVSPVRENAEETVEEAVPKVDPVVEAPYQSHIPVDDPSLQDIWDGLWVAFAEGNEKLEDLPQGDGIPYTHIITIAQGDSDSATYEQNWEGRVQRLRLYLPGEARAQRARKALALTDEQLRAARDFLIQALPATESGKQNSDVCVLITTPFGRPTDALCVVVCYVRATLKKEADEITKFLDMEDDILSVWKGEVCEDESDRIDKIAQGWSWLDQIVTHPQRD